MRFESITDMFRTFNTEEKCRDYLAQIRWNGKPICVHCGHDEKIYVYSDNKTYKCSCCKKKFTVTMNSVLQSTHIKLTDWFYAIYVLANHQTSLSAKQLSKDINVTLKTAWFMLQRIRQAMRERSMKLFGEVEIDETFVGGKNKNRHAHKKVKNAQGRSLKDKAGIYGFTERGGRVRTMHLGKLKGRGMRLILAKFVDKSSTIYSDEYKGYNGLAWMFEHHFFVNHGSGQYVDGNSHTNTIESFWSRMKSGITNTYRRVSKHKLFRYCYEYEFRWNNRFEESIEKRFQTLVEQAFGKRLTYAMATERTRWKNG